MTRANADGFYSEQIKCVLDDGSIWNYRPDTKEWGKEQLSTGELESSLKEHIKNNPQ